LILFKVEGSVRLQDECLLLSIGTIRHRGPCRERKRERWQQKADEFVLGVPNGGKRRKKLKRGVLHMAQDRGTEVFPILQWRCACSSMGWKALPSNDHMLIHVLISQLGTSSLRTRRPILPFPSISRICMCLISCSTY
jgi:hypothetical protein